MLIPQDFRTAMPDGEAEDAESGQHKPQLEDSEGSFVHCMCYTVTSSEALFRRPAWPDDAILKIQTNVIYFQHARWVKTLSWTGFFDDNGYFQYRIPRNLKIFARKWQPQFVQVHTGDLNSICTALFVALLPVYHLWLYSMIFIVII